MACKTVLYVALTVLYAIVAVPNQVNSDKIDTSYIIQTEQVIVRNNVYIHIYM